MRNLALCLLCFSCLAACSKNKCHPESFDYTLLENKALDTVTYNWPGGPVPFFGTTIANGQSTIVRYIHSYKYCDEHTDQSYETLMFEIPPNTTTFSIADSISLRQAKAIFSFWPTGSEEAYFLTQGSIEGKKLSDGSWQVKASLFSPKGGNRIAFNNRFQPVN